MFILNMNYRVESYGSPSVQKRFLFVWLGFFAGTKIMTDVKK